MCAQHTVETPLSMPMISDEVEIEWFLNILGRLSQIQKKAVEVLFL